MRCPQCSADAASGQRFCGQCGARLPPPCPACGTANPPSFRFCGACGAALEAAAAPGAAPTAYTPAHLAEKIRVGRGALEGERRQVTVLFADVAGFTTLAERLDPEDVHAVIEPCVRLLMDEVHRYEGTVTQFTGDGIMALFGAPIAHENAAERAVRAALGMQAALRRYDEELRATRGLELRVRIGIHTGLVVVGRIGDDLRMEYTAIGDTTNLAQRLQTVAPPGGILVSEPVAKQLAGRFATRAIGPLALKGKSERVAAFEVLRALPRVPLVAADHDLAPLVGRRVELATLEARFQQAAAGSGQVVFVIGEAGIGKSRLLHEFRRGLENREHTWVDGRCVSFSREIPFLAIIDVVKSYFGIDETDGEGSIIAKLRAGIAALGPTAAAAEPYVRALLAADPGDPAVAAMDASARRFATFDALKRLTLASAAERPLVVLIEDLHWLDAASEEYLTYVIDALAGVRVLLLCTYRPGYRPPFPERTCMTRLALQPLSGEETARLAAAVVGAERFPPEVQRLIADKAEGNPFFIEEVTKCLLETGALVRAGDGFALGRPASEIIIPDTIHGLIMARIDRLGDGPKRAIQVASVIGREFAVRLLQRAAGLGEGLERLMGELRSLELIYERSGLPELAYMFKHALTHDVAYASLLVQRRRQLHRTIGLAIEELYADRLAEYWETLAHHFYEGEDWPRAFAYLERAADKARASYANGEAIWFYDRALGIAASVDAPPARRAALLAGKAAAHFCRSEFAEAAAAYRGALELVTDDAERARLQVALAEVLVWAHEFDAALATAAEAAASPAGASDPAVVSEQQFVTGFVYGVRGQLDEAVACIEAAERIATAAGRGARAAESRVFHGLIANWRGQYGVAMADMEPVVGLLEQSNEWLTLAQAYSHYAITLGGAGQYARALDTCERGIRLSESIGDRVWRARAWNTRGWLLAELGAHDEAEAANRRCLEIAAQLGSLTIVPELVGNAEANLADLALARGDASAAAPHLEAVARILGDPRNEWMTWRYAMHYRAAGAEAALAHGDLARARDLARACRETAARTRARRYLVRADRILAACRVATGDLAGGAAVLERAATEARALGNPAQLWQTLLAHGRTLHALGRPDEARAAWQEARAAMAGVAAAVPPALQAALRTSAPVTALAELAD